MFKVKFEKMVKHFFPKYFSDKLKREEFERLGKSLKDLGRVLKDLGKV
jgi:hypothetical protein